RPEAARMSDPPVPTVFDCQIYLQAALSERGPAFRCLRLAEDRIVALFVSAAVLAELEDVLTRPELVRKNSRLTPAFVQRFLQRVREASVSVSDVPTLFQYARDPDDEPYVNLALAVDAEFLVTRDRDLLDLMDEARSP